MSGRGQVMLKITLTLTLTLTTGVNAAGDAGDTSPNILVGGDVNGNIPPNIITYFRI